MSILSCSLLPEGWRTGLRAAKNQRRAAGHAQGGHLVQKDEAPAHAKCSFFAFCNINPAGCWQWPSPICTTAVPNCTCATAQTQASKSQTWKGNSWGRKTTLYQRNLFSSLSPSFNFTRAFFRVLTAPSFPGRGHNRDEDTTGMWTHRCLQEFCFGWEALAGISFTQTLQFTLFIWCAYWKCRGHESAAPPVHLPKALHTPS